MKKKLSFPSILAFTVVFLSVKINGKRKPVCAFRFVTNFHVFLFCTLQLLQILLVLATVVILPVLGSAMQK